MKNGKWLVNQMVNKLVKTAYVMVTYSGYQWLNHGSLMVKHGSLRANNGE